MMTLVHFANLPSKSSDGVVCCEVDDNAYHVYASYPNNKYRGNSTICRISRSEKSILQDIASVIECARDQGYQQALIDVRRSLGIIKS